MPNHQERRFITSVPLVHTLNGYTCGACQTIQGVRNEHTGIAGRTAPQWATASAVGIAPDPGK